MNSKLSILHLNIRSIIATDKKTQLDQLIYLHNPDFISLNETFLKPSHSLVIEGYEVFRHDRQIRKGGGAALCVRNSIKGKLITFDDSVLEEYAVGFLATPSISSTKKDPPTRAARASLTLASVPTP